MSTRADASSKACLASCFAFILNPVRSATVRRSTCAPDSAADAPSSTSRDARVIGPNAANSSSALSSEINHRCETTLSVQSIDYRERRVEIADVAVAPSVNSSTHHLCRFSTERNGFVKTNTRLLVGNWRAQSSTRLLRHRMRALHRAETRRDSIASNASIMSIVSGGALCKRNPSSSSAAASSNDDRSSPLPSRSTRAPPPSTPVVVCRGSGRRPGGRRGMRCVSSDGRLARAVASVDATSRRVRPLTCGASRRRRASCRRCASKRRCASS